MRAEHNVFLCCVRLIPHHIAEEGGYGKIKLLEKGGYEGMDACLM